MFKNSILVADLLKSNRHISKLMHGGKCIYYPLQQKEDEKELGYFHFEALENGSTVKLPSMLQYSIDSGETWVQGNGGTLTLSAGDKIYYKGVNTAVSEAFANQEGGLLNVKGNIMSLLYGDNYEGQTVIPEGSRNFYLLFRNSYNIVSASDLLLPATTLTNGCYQGMFYSCTSLTTAPELPATTLTVRCYAEMFQGCLNLNYIKMMATSSPSNRFDFWVADVAENGTFVKDADFEMEEGEDGIPVGWTVINE